MIAAATKNTPTIAYRQAPSSIWGVSTPSSWRNTSITGIVNPTPKATIINVTRRTYACTWNSGSTSSPAQLMRNSSARSSVENAMNPPARNNTTDEATNPTAYRFSFLWRAGTTNFQSCQSTTGSASTIPP